MVNITDWRPDTCSCHVRYSYDDSTGLSDSYSVVKQCDIHKNVNPSDLYKTLREENGRKNRIVGAIKETLNKELAWSFDKDRKLVLDVAALSVVEKSTALNSVNAINVSLPDCDVTIDKTKVTI